MLCPVAGAAGQPGRGVRYWNSSSLADLSGVRSSSSVESSTSASELNGTVPLHHAESIWESMRIRINVGKSLAEMRALSS